MEMVDKLGYLPNRLASVFAGDQTSTFVGVSIPDLGNEVFAQVSPLDMSVGINHFDCGYEMGRFLISCGYRELGYVGTSHDTANAATARLEGFSKAVIDGGGHVQKQLCLHDTASFYPGFYGSEQLVSSGAKVECIFYQNDSMAFGGLQYFTQKGLDVPQDMGIAGWGDLPVTSVLEKRLTSVHVPHLKLGQAAAEMMIARLSGEAVAPSFGHLRINISPKCRDLTQKLSKDLF